MGRSLTLPSFAKINWSLRVVGKRADNFHEVRTILQTISLHDLLHFETLGNADTQLDCNDAGIPTDNQNLVIRAVNSLRKHFGIRDGVSIRLEKNVPVQAGLGGGSSNAALTLLALTHLWELNVKEGELIEIAASLGADVPFFLLGGCVRATGIGTALQPQPDCTKTALAIVSPGVRVSTREAYAALNAPNLTPSNGESMLFSSQNSEFLDNSRPWEGTNFENDFEVAIFDIYPEIRRVKDALLGAGAAAALLSGSGSSVFGVFADHESRQSALKKIKVEAGWRIFPCDTLSPSEYRQAIGEELFRSCSLNSDRIGA